MKDEDRYVPAAGRKAFTALYDPVMALSMREGRWRPKFAEQVLGGLKHAAVVVDVGSGTGAFASHLSTIRPDVKLIGIDGDPQALAIARRKSESDRFRWIEGTAGSLPLETDSCDAVVLSLLLHHLGTEKQVEALREARRVLRSGGMLHVADWGKPDPVTFGGFALLRALDGFSNTKTHAHGVLPSVIADSGFSEVAVWDRLRTFWGTLELISAAGPPIQ